MGIRRALRTVRAQSLRGIGGLALLFLLLGIARCATVRWLNSCDWVDTRATTQVQTNWEPPAANRAAAPPRGASPLAALQSGFLAVAGRRLAVSAANTYARSLRTVWDSGHRQRSTPLLFGGLALVLAAVLTGLVALLVRIARAHPRRSISRQLDRSAPELMALCNEFVSLDHVFAAKGNITGAVARIRDVCQRCNLSRDPDLNLIADRLEPWYSRFIYRLISEPKTVEFVNFVETTARDVAPRPDELHVVEMTKQQFERRFQGEEFEGHWLVKIQNWDRPDIYRDFRVFADTRAERYFEHWLADNSRYARRNSVIVLDYSVNTAWNRKMTLRLYNDSGTTMNFGRPHSNLSAQIQELSRDYGSFLEISRQASELGADEKLWLRYWDFISILEDIYRRQNPQSPTADRQPPTGGNSGR